MVTDRRLWLKQSTLALAGLGLAQNILAAEKRKFFFPGNPILLNSNENAYGPSPLARKAIIETYQNSNRYPDDYISSLKKKIATHWSVNQENILLGAGSSEIIGLACQYASKKKGNIVTAEPSYRVWNSQATAFDLSFTRVALNEEKKYDLNKMADSIDNETRMVYICNPNNPTGTHVDIESLKDFATQATQKNMVFIDEAYTEFAGLPSLSMLTLNNPNIIVAKTFSKVYGLAGARVGYAIAHPDTIKKISSLQPWPDANVSLVSATAASAALDDQDFVKNCKLKAEQARNICYQTFKQLGLDFIHSSTNFILFNIDKVKGDFTKRMQAKNIYVQFREHFGGKWCRVSMGTIEEMQQFSLALKEIVF
jgi:histidinol-phosphate aminotransferase